MDSYKPFLTLKMICYSLLLTAHPPQLPTRLQAWSPVASQCYISELLWAPAHPKPGYFLHSHKSVALDSNSSNKHLFEFPTYCRWSCPPLLDQGSGFVTSISRALLIKLLVKSPKKKKKKENSLAEFCIIPPCRGNYVGYPGWCKEIFFASPSFNDLIRTFWRKETLLKSQIQIQKYERYCFYWVFYLAFIEVSYF